VTPEAHALGVAPGQACVFYDGSRVLGGGWIERVEVPARLPPPPLLDRDGGRI